MTMLHEGTDPAQAVPPPEALAYAREYARRGLGFEVLRRAYRTAQAAFTRMWLERLRLASHDPDSFAEAMGFFNDWLFSWMDAIERQLIEPYMQERERGSAARPRCVPSRCGRSSTAGAWTWPRPARGWATSCGASTSPTWSTATAPRVRPRTGRTRCTTWSGWPPAWPRRWGRAASWPIPLGGHLACWAGLRGGGDLDDLGARLDVPAGGLLRVAVGLPGHGLEGFRRSHREALLAGRAAEVLGYGSRGYVQFAESALDVLLTQDVEEARRFVERELGPLAADSDSARRLVVTLRIFFEEGASFVRAARRLGVHENTIAYRVQRAEELLGYPVAERRLELRVALRLVSLVS